MKSRRDATSTQTLAAEVVAQYFGQEEGDRGDVMQIAHDVWRRVTHAGVVSFDVRARKAATVLFTSGRRAEACIRARQLTMDAMVGRDMAEAEEEATADLRATIESLINAASCALPHLGRHEAQVALSLTHAIQEAEAILASSNHRIAAALALAAV